MIAFIIVIAALTLGLPLFGFAALAFTGSQPKGNNLLLIGVPADETVLEEFGAREGALVTFDYAAYRLHQSLHGRGGITGRFRRLDIFKRIRAQQILNNGHNDFAIARIEANADLRVKLRTGDVEVVWLNRIAHHPREDIDNLLAHIAPRIIIDANTGNEIDESLASAWADNYKAAHPDELWFHFFGKNIFDDMLALPNFKNMDIEPATHDVELTPELLLIIWEDEAIASEGRTELLFATVYDASNACPPCAVL